MTLLRSGCIVRTSYGTGPYLVETVSDPCTCPSYVRWIEGSKHPSRPHVHLTCRYLHRRREKAWLNGYDPETGRSVWCKDRLFVVTQLELGL